MTDYMTSAASGTANTSQLTSVPYVNLNLISTLLSSAITSSTVDDSGFGYCYGACKLLDYLGYGSFVGSGNAKKADITKQYLGVAFSVDAQNPLVFGTSMLVNLLPVLAYQKIYFDFFSNPQWEKHLAYSYNVDYWDGTSPVTPVADMFKLRYADYPKDYYLGVLPASH